jgi:ferrous iron transport protein A
MFLSQLKKGQKAIVVDFSSVNLLIQRRLVDLGVYKGSELCLKGSLPFGGPCMIETAGQSIGIRRNEAASIMVRPV